MSEKEDSVTKFSILASLAVIVMLMAIPAVVLAQAQPPRPAVFGGTVSFDGEPAADGTSVSAVIDGEVVASTEADSGAYALRIAQPPGGAFAGKAVAFKVGGAVAAEKGTWEADGGAELNLTAVTPPPPATATPVPPGPAGAKGATGAAGAAGAKGDTGPAGAAGAAGAKGATGAAGAAGAKGDTGPAGAAGAAGAKGDTGPAGAAGPAGASGAGGGGGSMGIIALIIAIVAAIGAGGAFVTGRRS